MAIWLEYWFWLTLISLFVFLLERIAPWRPQRALRPQIYQDLFWLVFNGHILGLGLARVTAFLLGAFAELWGLSGLPSASTARWLAEFPLALQFLVFLVLKDGIEWCIHNLLHRVPWLWEFHKLHHSITTLDWIGSMRFHWMEVLVYKSLSYLPLVLLGVDSRVVLWVAIVGTLIGHLNHSNLRISWGPLRYVFNSPRMHVWHHDVIVRGGHGQNFGIVLSVWDWLFGTAHMPADQPRQLGFEDMEYYPTGLLARLAYPLLGRRRG